MIKSQDDLNPCNSGKRSSDVVISAVEKCERLQKQLDIAIKCLKKYAEIKDILMVSKDGTCQITLRDCEGYHLARETLKQIGELNK